MEEVTIVGSVNVDMAGDLYRLAEHSTAVVPAEPVEAVYVRAASGNPNSYRSVAVHAFTASGTPLVLGQWGLVPAAEAAGSGEKFDLIRPRAVRGRPVVGPFTPAPAGMVATFGEAAVSLPVVYFDLYGRPVTIDFETGELWVISEDDDLAGVVGLPVAVPPAT